MAVLKIDSREPEKMQEAMREEAEDSNVIQSVTITELETADFVCEDIGVERKEGSDFAASTQDRRVSEQADRMVEEFQHRYIVLEGHPFDLKYTNIGDRSLIGQQVSLCAKRDIRQVTTNDVEGTAYAVRRIVERSLKDESVGHVKTADVETDNTQVAMISQIDGVSVDKAEKILDEVYFDSLITCANDYEGGGREIMKDSLKCIDGIGEKTAEKILGAFS